MQYQDIIQSLSLAVGTSWASGINLYATLFALGFAGANNIITLPNELQMLASPLVIFAAACMYFIEFFADKIPGVDSLWDIIHTFIRIPFGALLASDLVAGNPSIEIAAAILGGGIAASTHVTKTSTRMLINTSPEPVTNWTASIAEDLSVFAGLWVALHYPILFLTLFIIFILILIWLLPKIFKGLKKVFSYIKSKFSKQET